MTQTLSGIRWRDSFDAAVREARETDRFALVHFHRATCDGCRFLDDAVFPDHDLQDLLNDEFVPTRVAFDASHGLRGRFDVVWTPTLVLVDGYGEAHQRVAPATLPARELVGALLTALGRAWLARRAWDDAVARFDRVLAGDPVLATPEALYWRGVARARAGSADEPAESWTRLAAEHPGTSWAQAVAFLDAKR
jgi:hypothetical protein